MWCLQQAVQHCGAHHLIQAAFALRPYSNRFSIFTSRGVAWFDCHGDRMFITATATNSKMWNTKECGVLCSAGTMLISVLLPLWLITDTWQHVQETSLHDKPGSAPKECASPNVFSAASKNVPIDIGWKSCRKSKLPKILTTYAAPGINTSTRYPINKLRHYAWWEEDRPQRGWTLLANVKISKWTPPV